jgi:hypothetical protein
VFFVTVGMKVQPAMLNPFAENAQFGIAIVLAAVAVASKLVTGLAVYQRGVRRWPVAVGMVPRGEVGLIFAGTGLAAGVIAGDLYSALVVVVILTTFVTALAERSLQNREAACSRCGARALFALMLGRHRDGLPQAVQRSMGGSRPRRAWGPRAVSTRSSSGSAASRSTAATKAPLATMVAPRSRVSDWSRLAALVVSPTVAILRAA